MLSVSISGMMYLYSVQVVGKYKHTIQGTAARKVTWTFIESFWWGLMTLTTVGYEGGGHNLSG